MDAAAVDGSKKVSRRATVMNYVWGRCIKAWAEDDPDQARNLHRMYSAFEEMTDEEWDSTYDECDPNDL